MKVGYPSGSRTINLSPWGRRNVKRIARRSYSLLSSSVATSPRTSDHVIATVSQTIRKEIKAICSTSHDSILLDTNEGIKHFNWETVYTELVNMLPTLMKVPLFYLIVPALAAIKAVFA